MPSVHVNQRSDPERSTSLAPAKFEFAINVKAAEALGLNVPALLDATQREQQIVAQLSQTPE